MKILYAVQATGNGHISRAIQIMPYLQKYGQIDIFLSGSNSTLPIDLPVKYRSRGISLFNDKKGGLDFIKIIRKNHWLNVYKQAKSLPVERYDFIINDFEPICAKACLLKNKKSIQFSHQASFRSPLTPRPDRSNIVGEWIFKSYAVSSNYIGLHFKNYDDFIVPPVIKRSILDADPTDLGHITVYLFGFDRAYFESQFHPLNDLHFHCFIPGIQTGIRSRNINFYPVDDRLFTQSMLTCHGIVTGCGFETPSEALYLRKKLICIPCKNHYEQACNAAALRLLGVRIISSIEKNKLQNHIVPWINQPFQPVNLIPNNIRETLQKIFDTYSSANRFEYSPELLDQIEPSFLTVQ